jgi:hypothetical protein
MTAGQMDTWLNILKTQGIQHFIYRFNAFSEYTAETSQGISTFNTLMAKAKAAGINVSVDLHTWYTTWNNALGNSPTAQSHYLSYIKNVLGSIDPGYKAAMVLNEPAAATATPAQNDFIISCISTAKGITNKPIGVRFMGGYSPTTGHYSPDIDAVCDIICRNTYFDPRTGKEKYGSNNDNLTAAIDSAKNQGKPFWFTEFGYPKDDLAAQASYISAFLPWASSKGASESFAWVAQPTVSGETYNLFNGLTPNPAFYMLTSTTTIPDEPPMSTAKVYGIEFWEIGKHGVEGTTSILETIDNAQVISFNPGQATRTNLTEINSKWIAVNQGDTVIMRSWIKSDLPALTYKYGLVASFDLYGASGRLFEGPVSWTAWGTDWKLSEVSYKIADPKIQGIIAFLGANFRFNPDGSQRTWGEVVPAKHSFIPQICIVPQGATMPAPPAKPVVQEPPITPTPTPTPTPRKTLAARVPCLGNSKFVQVGLRKLRDEIISEEVHKKLHPLV